ncbi:hypothetical protein UXO17_22210, partial [Enterobacter bugandensis]
CVVKASAAEAVFAQLVLDDPHLFGQHLTEQGFGDRLAGCVGGGAGGHGGEGGGHGEGFFFFRAKKNTPGGGCALPGQ